MKVKRFFQKTKLRKIVIPVLLLFMAIVGCLTTSSSVINRNMSEHAVNNTPASTKAIIQTEDEDFEESLSSDDGVSYTKIGSDIYVVNYDNSDSANQAVNETYANSENVTTNYDTIFKAAGNGNFKKNINVQKATDVLTEGMTWREYADSVGKKLVAVIDTGVSEDYSAVNMNFTDEADEDENGHGTMVAQTIIENADGKAIIMSLKALGADGTGYMSDVMKAVQYAREQHVDIINMSISAEDTTGNSVFKSQITSAISEGIQIVAAAGNYNTSSSYYIPANIDGVISVGAIDSDGNKIKTSNFNATYYEEADSSSIAAAKIAGKIASGNDLSGEKKDSDIKYNSETVNTKNTLDKIYASDATEFVVDTKEHATSHALDSFFDEKSKQYYYTYSSSKELFKDWPKITDLDSTLEYYSISKKKNKPFTIQYTKYPITINSNGKGRYWLSGGNDNDLDQSWHRGNYTGYVNEAFNDSNDAWPMDIHYESDYGYYCPVENPPKAAGVAGVIGTISNREWTLNFYPMIHYTLYYNGNGGTRDKEYDQSNALIPGNGWQIYGSNGKVAGLAGANRTYYKFLGWGSSKDDNKIDYGQKDSPSPWFSSGDKTAYAKWEPYKLKVEYYAAGAQSGVPAPQEITYGVATNLSSSVPVKWGYTFDHWTTNGPQNDKLKSNVDVPYRIGHTNTYMAMTWDKVVGNLNGQTVTLYGVWKENTYNVVFNKNDNGQRKTSTTATGTVANVTDALYDHTTVTIPEGYTKEGYVFTGWNTKPDGSGTRCDNGQKGNYLPGEKLTCLSATKDSKGKITSEAKTVTLYAQWEPISYNITFDSNKETHVRKNSKDSRDYSLTKSSETTQIVSGSTASQSQTFDKAVALTANGFKWEGHTFLGWSTDKNATVATWKDGNTASYNFNTTGGLSSTDKDNVTLYAIWKADAHTVTIDPVKGSGTWNPAGDPNQSGSSAVRKGEDSVNKDKAGNTKWGDKVILGEAIPDNKDATVTYDVNTDEPVNIDKTSETVHWKFSKWTKNTGANGILYNNSSRTNDGSHDNGAQTYYIIQDTNDTVTANYYMQSVVLPTPSRDGYTFLGWYYDAGCTDKVDGRGPGGTKYPLDANGEEMKSEYQTRGNGGDTFRTDRDITIYARWQKNSYNYADTLQAFMQDANGTSEQKVMIRKIDKKTKQPLTSVTVNGKTSYFKLEVYKKSISSSNKVITIQTDTGVFDAVGNKLAGKTADADGWYDVSAYLTPGETYIVHESIAAPGYSIAKDQTFVYTPDTTTQISVEDEIVHPGNTYFLKLDSHGRPMSNVVFTLKDETTGEIIKDFKTNRKGEFSAETDPVTGKPTITMYNYCTAGHRYSLTEKSAPAGFKLAAPVYFTMPDDGSSPATITVEDTPKTAGKLQIQKLNHDDEPLAGAVFQLFTKDADGNLQTCYMKKSTNEWVSEKGKSDDVVEMIGTTGDDGIVTFKNLPVNASYTGSEPDFTKKYYLKEVQAPEGYSLLTDIMEIRLPEDSDGQIFTYTVKDDSVTLTLEAGSFGNPMIYVGCGAIALLSVLALIRRRYITA